jgi:hypothetical protein
MSGTRSEQEQCPSCGAFGTKGWPICGTCGKAKHPPDDHVSNPDDFDYAALEKELEELEAEEPAVRAARDQYEAAKRELIEQTRERREDRKR